MNRLVLALCAVAAAGASENKTCLASSGGTTTLVGVYQAKSCVYGPSAGRWAGEQCVACEHGCVSCADGNVVALAWQCHPRWARDGEILSLFGNTERVFSQEAGFALGMMMTHCVQGI
jgi:hypothetical protein